MAIAQRKHRSRNPGATRAVILEATCTLLARDGPEGISFCEVALLAGVNRSSAYRFFKCRENLINEALIHVSEKLYCAVFGDPNQSAPREIAHVDIYKVTEDLASFAMENPELCRIWLLQILSAPDPASDPFWREFAGSIGRFAETELAQSGIDVEVFSIIALAGTFLWPIWAGSHMQNEHERASLTQRFARELMRLSLHGTIWPEKVPRVVARVEAHFGSRELHGLSHHRTPRSIPIPRAAF